MEKRVHMNDTEPQAFKAMFALEGYLATTGISKTLQELIKMRASQINHCAFCLNSHSQQALAHGETAQRLFLLNAWRETDLFTEEEKVVLAITEEITLIHEKGLTEETYQKATRFFDKNTIAQLIMAVVTINAWNRIAVSTHLEVPR